MHHIRANHMTFIQNKLSLISISHMLEFLSYMFENYVLGVYDRDIEMYIIYQIDNGTVSMSTTLHIPISSPLLFSSIVPTPATTSATTDIRKYLLYLPIHHIFHELYISDIDACE
jgi:hypothetical protein